MQITLDPYLFRNTFMLGKVTEYTRDRTHLDGAR